MSALIANKVDNNKIVHDDGIRLGAEFAYIGKVENH